jgi:two-component system, response regulator YesN
MTRLLIVDDERTTRESLTTYIPWADLGIGSVQAARNGIEALSLAADLPPDLLITDVRMPKMDGIALAEKVRALYPRCKIIFLSGYADKEYLKKAISLRAVGYIEKPIDPAEVLQVARTAVTMNEEEARSREGPPSWREETARALIQGRDAAARQQFPRDCPFTVAIVLVRWDQAHAFADRETSRNQILAALEMPSLAGHLPLFCGFTEADVCAVVAAARLTEASPKARALFPALTQELEALGRGRFTWSLGVGAPVAGVADIPRSYDSALHAGRLCFYRGQGKVIFPRARHDGHFSVGTAAKGLFREALRDNDREHALRLVDQLSQEARRCELTDINSVRNAFFDLLLAVFDAAPRGPVEDSEKTYVWQEVHERATLDELTQLVGDNLRALPADAQPRARESRTVMDIQRFLREHYASPGISLQVIADHARLSRTYVSFLFKSVTGENVNDYITRLRLTRAKELLLDAGIKAGEVASRVGYADSNYFSTIFRKHVGMSPTEFRENAGSPS